MTAPRRPRSAWLLVGSTPSVWVKVQVAGHPKAVVAELLLFGHAFAVGGEVSEEVGPAELPPAGVEVVVTTPAVGADDASEALAEQRPGLEGVAAGCDPEHRAPAGQRAPERPVAAGGLPADRVDRAGRELDPEQLAGELGRVAARDPVADSERHDRGLQSRPERRPRHLAGKLGAG